MNTVKLFQLKCGHIYWGHDYSYWGWRLMFPFPIANAFTGLHSNLACDIFWL